MRIKLTKIIAIAVIATGVASVIAAPQRRSNPDAKLHRFSSTIEKERPQLDEETRRLIANYRRDPNEANKAALKNKIARNYDVVVARKKAKLEELKRTARHKSKIDEMQTIG